MASDGSIKISTELDTKSAKQAMSQFSGESQKGLSGIKTAASVMSAAVVTATAAAASAVIKLGAEFNAQMSTVQAISGATATELDALKKHAEYMGATTQFTAKQSGEAMEYMAMAGWKTNDMLSGLEGIMYAAGASGEDLAMVSDIVTDGLTAFGLSAKESGRFADVLAAASSNSNTNIGMMGETFKYVGSVAGAFGYTIEDTSVAIGLMANSGIKASQAGTSLRQILLGLQGGAELTGTAFGTTRIEVENTDGTMRELNDVMVDLRSAFGQMTEAEKAQNAELIAGKIGMSGLLAIVNSGENDFNKLTTAIENSTGVAQKMNEISLDNLQGDVTILSSTLEGFGIQVYNSFDEPFRKAAQGATKAVNGIAKELAKPDMKKSLDNIGDGMADLAVSATKLATNVIPPLVSTIDNSIKAFDTLAPAIISVTTAIGVVKGINAFGDAMDAAEKTLVIVGKSTDVMTVALGKKATAEAIAAAATKANMTVNAAGQIITQSGAIATAAETTAIMANAGAISMKTLVLGVMTGQIGLATAAQMAWNAAITANPVGLLVVGIGTLIAAGAALLKALDKESEAAQKTRETVEELSEQHDKLKESIDTSKGAYDDSTKSISVNTAVAENLVKNIEKLSKAEKLNSGETKLLKGWIDELNTLMPELNIYYDEQTGKVEGLTDATYSRIDSIEKEAKAEAQRQYITELYKQQAEAQIGLEMSQYRLKEAIEEYGEDAYNSYINATDAQKKYSAATKELEEIFAPLIEQEQLQADTLNGLSNDIKTYEDAYTGSMSVITDSASSSLQQISGSFNDTSTVVCEMTEEQSGTLGKLQEEYEKLAESALNMFDKISGKSEYTIDEMIANLKHNQEAISQWSNNISLLAEAGINAGLLETLRLAGPESAGLVQEIVDGGKEKWKELSDQYAAGGKIATEALASTLRVTDEIAASAAAIAGDTAMQLNAAIAASGFESSGSQITGDVAKGISESSGAVATEASHVVSAITNMSTQSKAQQDKSSQDFDTYTKAVSGYLDKMSAGLSENEAKQLGTWLAMVADTEMNGQKISTEAQKMVDTVLSNLDKMPAGTRETMKNAMSPMIEEMEKSEPTLFQKASSIANGILSRLKKAFDIHSPARTTRKIFQQVMQGSGLGLKDEEKNLYNQVDDISSEIIDKFNGIDAGSWVQKFHDAAIRMQMDYAPEVQMANAIAKVSLQTGDAADDSGIDYNRMGVAVKKALNGVKVDIDGKTAGTLISPYVDRSLGRAERVKGRT